jgi:hypothetical protein
VFQLGFHTKIPVVTAQSAVLNFTSNHKEKEKGKNRGTQQKRKLYRGDLNRVNINNKLWQHTVNIVMQFYFKKYIFAHSAGM